MRVATSSDHLATLWGRKDHPCTHHHFTVQRFVYIDRSFDVLGFDLPRRELGIVAMVHEQTCERCSVVELACDQQVDRLWNRIGGSEDSWRAGLEVLPATPPLY